MAPFLFDIYTLSSLISCSSNQDSSDITFEIENGAEIPEGYLVVEIGDSKIAVDTSRASQVYDEEGNLIYENPTYQSDSFQVGSNLNGDVIYRLQKNDLGTYIKTEVFKYEYKSELYSVSISSDTIELGDEVILFVRGNHPNYSAFRVSNFDTIRLSDNQNYRPEIHLTPESSGVYPIHGFIKLSKSIVPFEYKVVVE